MKEKIHILLVDDEADFLFRDRKTARAQGICGAERPVLRAAGEIIDSGWPDIVVLDVMPA